MRKIFCMMISLTISFHLLAQPWVYDFGTGTGTANNTNSGSGNTTFFTSTPAGGGTYRVRIGTMGGSLVLANPGTSLGSETEAQLIASVTGSTNKMTVYNWNGASTGAYLKCKLRTTSSDKGTLVITLGSGAASTPYQDNNNYSNSYNAYLAALVVTYNAGSIASVQRRISGGFSTITGSGISKDADQVIEIYGNNAATATAYERSGANSLNAQAWDLWVDNVKISPAGGYPVAGTLASGVNLAGFGFFAESSAANVADMYMDDLEYSNALPAAICTVPATQASELTFSNINATSLTANWTAGSGAKRILVMNTTNSFANPADGTDPIANSTYSGNGEQVVFNGSTNNVTISGLADNTTYWFRVYEYNCTGTSTKFNTSSSTNNPLNQVTLAQVIYPFATGNLAVYRVGDGSAALSGNATAAFIDEYTMSGTLVQSIPMPITVVGVNRRITNLGNSTSEGMMTRSGDRKYLLVTGYDAVINTASPNSSAGTDIKRVIGRVSANGAIDATTALEDFASGSNPRSVYSSNGTDVWMVGGSGGIRYTTIGSTGTSTGISTTLTNIRNVHAFGNQLYVSSGAGTIRMGTVGSGMPTTSNQTIDNLPNFPTNGSNYQFYFADLDPTVTGVDVLYVADDGIGPSTTNAGLQKYSLVGGTWVSNGLISISGNNLRGLTGTVSGTSVTLYGTTAFGTTSTIVSLTDASGYNSTISGTFTTLATAPSNTAFRGIAFTPIATGEGPLPVHFTSIKATKQASGVKIEWSNSTETDVVSYAIERSANGNNFSQLSTITARYNNGGKADYFFIDASMSAGDQFYRIKSIEADGKIAYSSVVKINTGKNSQASLNIYPNPVTGGEAGLQIVNLPAGNYSVQVYNTAGQLVVSGSLQHNGGSVTETLPLNRLKSGWYTLRITGLADLKKTFVVQ